MAFAAWAERTGQKTPGETSTMEREKLYRLLRLGLEKGASDIHFQVDYLPLYRFHGELVELRYKVLTPEDTQAHRGIALRAGPRQPGF